MTDSSLHQLIVKAIEEGANPREFLQKHFHMDPDEVFSNDISESQIWISIIAISSSLYYHKKAPIKNFDYVINLIKRSKKIIVIIGAGASVGPDFRSIGGLYDQIKKDGALEDPFKVFDIHYFQNDPSIFWKYAKLIFPSVHPDHSATHLFLSALASQNKLLRVYSQNVDTLEYGLPDSILRCVHGSWRNSRCLECGKTFSIEDLRPFVEKQAIPKCSCGGQIKPGIVFFGQPIVIDEAEIISDAENGDLLIVIGTSLKVSPISSFPNIMSNISSILINREPIGVHFSAELLGNCSEIVHTLCMYMNIDLKDQIPDNEKSDVTMREIESSNHVDQSSITFYDPNKFIWPSTDGTQCIEDGRSNFLVTPVLAGNEPNFE